MAYTKREPTKWGDFTISCNTCHSVAPAREMISTFISGGCETCEYSTYVIKCPTCKAQDGSDW